jgi:hypothetical protein
MGYHLAELTERALADQLQAQGQAPQAQRLRTVQAQQPLAKANQALNQLANRVRDSAQLVNGLKRVR